MNDYQHNRAWSDARIGQIKGILAQFAPMMADFDFADSTPDEDMSDGIDGYMVLRSKDERIALRVRNQSNADGRRDFTVRYRAHNGGKTEFEKLPDRKVRWYFYGWADDAGRITEWMMVDVFAFLDSGLLDKMKTQVRNRDKRTQLKYLEAHILIGTGCVVAHRIPFLRERGNYVWTDEERNADIAKRLQRAVPEIYPHFVVAQ